jgi:hypothetical protein
MPGFSLRKWYLDIADDLGHVYIGYWVSLRWGRLKLDGLQHLWRIPGEGIETQTEITRKSAPEWQDNSRLIWKPEKLEAIWESTGNPVEATLLDVDGGKIVWRCTQPRARASVASSRLSFSGWGYTECIDVTIPPWKLPFNKLYWGRCHTSGHYVVWVKWEGREKQSLLWFDGTCSRDFTIEDDGLAASGILLRLSRSSPLRQGKIGSTLFQPFPHIARLLPRSVLSVHERKWYSRGILETSDGPEPATVIHEEVSW